jgi:hypothetical protein
MHRHRPGPEPLFTHRLNVKIRDDQRKAIDRLASALGFTASGLVRWILDNGIDALERSHAAVQEELNAQS